MAALCEYWSLDHQMRKCYLKESNLTTISSDSVISGMVESVHVESEHCNNDMIG